MASGLRCLALKHEFAGDGLCWIPKRVALVAMQMLCMVVYGPSATERPLGSVREENGISALFQVSISSRYDLSC